MGKITVEVKINTFGTMLYSLNHPSIYDRDHLLLEELKIMKNMCLSFGAYLKPI